MDRKSKDPDLSKLNKNINAIPMKYKYNLQSN
jgi:hypothetical protein